jgi:hypothetical protein
MKNIAKDDLLTCIDTVYAALIDTYQQRRDLPDDIRCLLREAFIVLAVTHAILTRKNSLNGRRP